jgi:hypothetical protein
MFKAYIFQQRTHIWKINFNGNECGSALWNSVLRPTAAYGCSIWFPSSAAQNDLLERLQYF